MATTSEVHSPGSWSSNVSNEKKKKFTVVNRKCTYQLRAVVYTNEKCTMPGYCKNEITFPEYLPEQSCNITMKKKLHKVHLMQSKIEPCF